VRNRYLDLLRAAAIVRVIIYHLFGWPWLSILLPAMGVMFALAGSLTAASLDKRAARRVVTSRLRRLLPPLWLLGLIAVPVMLVAGWAHEVDGDHPFSLPRLAFWILPLGDPPGSDRGVDAWEPLWYIRAYVWFVLLSPVLYLLYRRIGWLAVALPIVLIAVLDKTGFALPDTADAALWDFVTYGACWIAGFAHHDGRLARLRPATVLATAGILGAAALYWLNGHQGPDAWDLNDVSESQALWSVAFVLVALRWQPPMGWLGRFKPLDSTVSWLNARAVTIYLWHNIAIAAVWPVLTVLTLDDLSHFEDLVALAGSVLLTMLAVLAFGWTEDLAAKRRPRLWPVDSPRTAATSPTHEPVLVGAGGVGAGSVGAGSVGAGSVGAGSVGAGSVDAGNAGASDAGAGRVGAGNAGAGGVGAGGVGADSAPQLAGPAESAADTGTPAGSAPVGSLPRSWPPEPRSASAPSSSAAAALSAGATAAGRGRHAASAPGEITRGALGFPVAGRRAEPLTGDVGHGQQSRGAVPWSVEQQAVPSRHHHEPPPGDGD
jgi:peptidoglycan/LPS O-acetylase OafA/YrhL